MKSWTALARILCVLPLLPVARAKAQSVTSVTDPHASVVDVPARHAALESATDPLVLAAIQQLSSCAALPFAPPPAGRMIIPNHYLHGSSGPVNPAQAPVERMYENFQKRVIAGTSQYLAKGSHAESAAALAQLDGWATAGALLNYSREESQQAWFQVEWTVSAAAICESVLVNDPTLDPAQQKRVIAWLDAVSHRDIGFERPADPGNNHHYWRALAATAVGVVAADGGLFHFGIDTYRQAIAEIDSRGAFPKEMTRHENAIHYQGFALLPLVMIAQLSDRQGYDLYSYQSHGKTLRDAIIFFGRAVDDPELVTPYTKDRQSRIDSSDFAAFPFYAAKFGTEGLPRSIVAALKHPLATERIGNTMILAAKP